MSPPPKIHVFLWLVSHNKIMTRDNLRKRRIIKPSDCVFCSEDETIHHLLFDCVVAMFVWVIIREHLKVDAGTDYLSVARFCLSNKKRSSLNVACAVTMWCIWKLRNSIIFNNAIWISVKQVLGKMLSLTKI